MSRSYGDGLATSVGVTSTPETTSFKLSSDDIFFVLASDGVWTFLSNESVVKTIGD